MRLLPAAGPLGLLLLGSTLLVQAFTPLALAIVTGSLVGRLLAAVGSGIGSALADSVLRALAALGALFLLSRFIGPVSSMVHAYITRRIDAAVQGRVMRAASLPVGIGHLEDPEVLDHLGQIGEPIGPVVVSVPSLVAASVTAIGAILIVGRVDWRIGAVLFVLVFVQRTFWRDFFLRMSDVRARMSRDLRRGAYLADLVLQPHAAKETRIFGLTDWITKAYGAAWARAVAPMWELDDRNLTGLLKFLPFRAASFAIPYVALVFQITSGRISLAAFTAAVQATGVAIGSARFREEDVYLEQMGAPIQALHVVEALPGPQSGLVPAPESFRQLRFRDVGFRYPGSSVPVYEGLSLAIPEGISTAIVGPNGAGKTTLVKLLARLYDPVAGQILIDDVDLVDLNPVSWRKQLAIIFQDFVKYPLSAKDNVAFGAPGLRPVDRALSAAASKSGATELVASLANGWDTALSRQFEGGTDLSGGQWQRIALARALYAVEAGAKILVLDEPTANLDVRAEAKLFDEFMEITRGLTTILISHRFSTVRRAENICVIDQGRLIEMGTHDELIAREGVYAHMFSVQAARFL